MTAPISNQNPLNVQSSRPGRTEALNSNAERANQAEAETSSSANSGDSLTLSDAARRLSESEGTAAQGPQSPDQALALLDRLKAKMAENPGFTHAVHTANANSRLAALLDASA